jgi:ACS family hexuronate transporter-like MFS transporter
VGGMVLATSTGFILQLTHSYASLFVVAASSYLLSFLVIVLLAPGLRRVELVS